MNQHKATSPKKKSETLILEKAPQLAFLTLDENIKSFKLDVEPFVKEDGRVAFKVSGDVSSALATLSQNPKVRILDFLNRLSAIRSLIFTLKKCNTSIEHET